MKPRTHEVVSEERAQTMDIGDDNLIEIVQTFKRRPNRDRQQAFERGTFFIQHDDGRFSAAVIVRRPNRSK